MVGRDRHQSRGGEDGGRSPVSPFHLTSEQLQEIVEAYRQKILEGLRSGDREIAALPTYLNLPSGEQKGRALVVDTGGTNMRAALVELRPADGELLAGPVTDKVPDGRQGEALQAAQFFGAQASLSQKLGDLREELPLGYCFSYPAESRPDGDAVLLRWTKGLRIDGVVGQAVGRALASELRNVGQAVRGVTVLNDTVASLLGGAHLYAEPRYGRNYIGLILGTGTNMAGVFSPQQLSKVTTEEPMVVNLESGNFDCPHLTDFDRQLDEASENFGAQRFEKAVSGHYLPQLFDVARPGLDLGCDASKLVALRDAAEGEDSVLAGGILQRSAKLAAAGLAAVVSLYPEDHDTAVLGEGGLLWGDPQFAPLVENTLRELLPSRNIELLQQRENVNLLGAACAALV